MKDHLGDILANSISHGIGFLLAIAGLVLLIIRASTGLELTAVIIYSLSLVFLYFFSTLHHSVPTKTDKGYEFFKSLDQVAIYFLIAGTYTPFVLINISAWYGYILLSFLWVIAFIGSFVKLVWPKKGKVFHIVMYVAMGWSIVIIWPTIGPKITEDVLRMIFFGGLAYTSGITFYVISHVKKNWHYTHLIWHLFVIMGSLFHFVAVYQIL